MEKDVLIVEENLMDNHEKEKASLEAILGCPEFNMDTDPLKIEKKHEWIFCQCGNIVIESPANQYICGNCGNIKYDKMEV